MIINVEFGISQYTAEELVNYDVYCGDYCLSELIDKIVDKDDTPKFTQEDLDEANQEGYRDGVAMCRAALDDL